MYNEIKINTPLSVDQISFRVQSINNGKYATILAYKDARADMDRLDSVFGVGNWQRKHELIGGVLYCSIGIWHSESKSWAWVQDCGTESREEKEKGQASDSFKRACINLGIGRELYSYPSISFKLNDNEVEVNKTGKTPYKATYNLRLKLWKWESEFENGKLIYLRATDDKGVVRFTYGKLPYHPKPEKTPPSTTTNKNTEPSPLQVTEAQYKKLADSKNIANIKKTIENVNSGQWILSKSKIETLDKILKENDFKSK